MTLHDVKPLPDQQPCLFEGDGENGLEIYFESEQTRRDYMDLHPHDPGVWLSVAGHRRPTLFEGSVRWPVPANRILCANRLGDKALVCCVRVGAISSALKQFLVQLHIHLRINGINLICRNF